jgi:CRISPR-associated protein Cas2
MSEKTFVVVAYDISNDRRRTRLHQRLLDYGQPVQFSVFECLLDAAQLKKMKAMVRKTIRPRLDHVRYYRLCAACREKIEVIGQTEVTDEPKTLVV